MSNQRNNNSKNRRQNNAANQQNGNDGFNIVKTTGLGYVSALQEHQSQKDGSYFTSCTIAALSGPKNAEKRQYKYINVYVVGDTAQNLIWQYEQDLLDKKNVLIQFCMSDIKAKGYLNNQGEACASLNANLYAIEKIWVDKELTYSSQPASGNEATDFEDNANNTGDYQNGYDGEQSPPSNKGGSRSTGGHQPQRQPSRNQSQAQQGRSSNQSASRRQGGAHSQGY